MTSKPEWKDVTPWKSHETDRSQPRTWEIRSGNVRVCVTRLHQLKGWFMHCAALHLDSVPLDSTSIEDAKREAVKNAIVLAQQLSNNASALMHTLNPPRRSVKTNRKEPTSET